MKALYYIVIGICAIFLLKILLSLTGIAIKFLLFLLFTGFVGYVVVSLFNRGKK